MHMYVLFMSMNIDAENKLSLLVKVIRQYLPKEPIDIVFHSFNNGITIIINII